jgi:excisionase family DNA binding protein
MEQAAKQPEPRCWTVSQTAAVLGLPLNGVYAAIARGQIPCIRIGRRVLVPKAQLEAMISGDITHSLTRQDVSDD